jgi:hypothetical protein
VVVVVPGGDVVVVVVFSPVGAVVLVVVVLVDGLEVVVVVDDVEVVGIVVGGDWLTRFPAVVPVSAPPKMAESGLPEMSSIAVMKSSANTNTMPTVAAIPRHENRPTMTGRRPGGGVGLVVACRRSVAGASATAEISRRSVAPTGAAVDAISVVSAFWSSAGLERTASVEADDDDAAVVEAAARVSPLAPVPPSLRNSVAVSGAFTTTCLTASWPRSIDCATKAVAKVAAAEPTATPMMVPLTPKVDAMTAAITAPAVEARICRMENFTAGVSPRR